MDKRIIKLKKLMVEHGVKPKDLVVYFDVSWTYVSALLNYRMPYLSDQQIQRFITALPKIEKSKKAAA